jgi:hypothetical protein
MTSERKPYFLDVPRGKRVVRKRKHRPGSSKEHPRPGLALAELDTGKLYQGWPCKNSETERVEFTQMSSDAPTAAPKYDRQWMKCAYCGEVDLYQMDRRTIRKRP